MLVLDIALGCAAIYYYRKSKRCSYTMFLNKAQFNKVKLRRKDDMIVLIDINDFKNINDTMGHKHGDQVIENTAKQIRQSLSLTDRAYRIGGDEFAIVTNTGFNCDRLRKNIAVSVSIGTGKTYEEADANMYAEKLK